MDLYNTQEQQAIQEESVTNKTPYYAPQMPVQAKPRQKGNPYYGGLNEEERHPELLTMADFLGMMFLGAIPIVGLVFLCVWSFGGKCGVNRRNYARAFLLYSIIMQAIAFVMFVAVWGTFYLLVYTTI